MSNQAYRNLSELKELARIAAAKGELIRIASSQSPSACIVLAKQMAYDDSEARSARWLAILRRDYGQEVFTDFCAEVLSGEASQREHTQVKTEVDFLVRCAGIMKTEVGMMHSTLDFFAGTEAGILGEAVNRLPRGERISDMIRELESAVQKLRGIEAYVND